MRLIDRDSTSENIAHRLSTNTLSNSKRIHRWGNFIAGFSIEFVEKCLSALGNPSKSRIVLDPFSGCGTTLLGAKNLGFPTIGYELHPVFHAIASGKLNHYRPGTAESVAEVLRSDCKPADWSPDAERFLHKLFTGRNLESVRQASGALSRVPPELRDLSVTMFLKACELACGSQTDGIYKAPTTRKNHIPFTHALAHVEEEFSEDINSDWYRHHWCKTPQASIHRDSALAMEAVHSESVACCITSPPYLNNFDYAEMTRMHVYLLAWCSSWRDISEKVRNHLVTNTTTALNGKKTEEYQVAARNTLPSALAADLDAIVSDLSRERETRAGKKEYDYLVYPYYSQIRQVLSCIHSFLKPAGKVHWVVADAALYGVHIETHEHTAEIMRSLGFKNVVVHHLRKRGHRWILSKRDGAKKGLGEYHIEGEK